MDKRRLWMRILATGLALAGTWWIVAVYRTPINRENFGRIQTDMLVDEVVTILGEPDLTWDLFGVPHWGWRSPTGYEIWISIDDHEGGAKVMYKGEVPLSQRVTMNWYRLRRGFGL